MNLPEINTAARKTRAAVKATVVVLLSILWLLCLCFFTGVTTIVTAFMGLALLSFFFWMSLYNMFLEKK